MSIFFNVNFDSFFSYFFLYQKAPNAVMFITCVLCFLLDFRNLHIVFDIIIFHKILLNGSFTFF